MSLLEILIIVYTILLIISFFSSHGSIFSPNVIFSLSFVFVLILADVFKGDMLSSTGETDLRIETFWILIICGMTFVFITSLIPRIKAKDAYPSKFYGYGFQVEESIMTLFVIIYMVCTLFALYEFFSSTSGGFVERAQQHRHLMRYSNSFLDFRYFVKLLYKVLFAIGHITAYELAWNYRSRDIVLKKRIFIILAHILYIMLFMGARGEILEFILFFVLSVLLIHFNTLTEGLRIKDIMRLSFVAIGLILLFILLIRYVGVNRSFITNGDVIRYVAAYAYCGIAGLNYYIFDPARSEYFGMMTFKYLYTWLYRFGIVPIEALDRRGSFWVKMNIVDSNTLTVFGRWYADFGVFGTVIITIIVGIVLGVLYRRQVQFRLSDVHDYLFDIVFIRIIIQLAYSGYDDHLSLLVSFTSLVNVLLIIFFMKISTSIRIVVR